MYEVTIRHATEGGRPIQICRTDDRYEMERVREAWEAAIYGSDYEVCVETW